MLKTPKHVYLTKKETIRALEIHTEGRFLAPDCPKCPLKYAVGCKYELAKNALRHLKNGEKKEKAKMRIGW